MNVTSRRAMLVGVAGATAVLAGCAAVEKKAVSAATATALTASQAQALYGIVKGVAEAAALAVPALGPVVSIAFAAMDPIAAEIEQGIASAEAVASLVSQANALTIAVAPKITVTGHA